MNFYSMDDVESGDATKIFEQVRKGEAVIIGQIDPNVEQEYCFYYVKPECESKKRDDPLMTVSVLIAIILLLGCITLFCYLARVLGLI